MTTDLTPLEKYASLAARIKGLVIDSIVLLLFIFIASLVLSLFNNVPDGIRIGLFLFIFFLYDPLFTSFFGATIGHMFIAVRVRQNADETKNITFPAALLRFVAKSFFGWISFLTISKSEKHRAIHDMVANSVVIYNV